MTDTDTTGVRRFRTNFNERFPETGEVGLLGGLGHDLPPDHGEVVQLYEPDPPGEIRVEAMVVSVRSNGSFLARPLDGPRRGATP